MPFVSQLEPDALVRQFMRIPPVDFSTQTTVGGAPSFSARFDLLTTAEPALQKRVRGLPGYRFWSGWLRPHTRFIGTTVSEYALLPGDMVPDAFARELVRAHGREHPFLIIKDIPHESPLLDADANRWAADLATACEEHGFVLMEGQALAWVPIDFSDADEYLSRLSRSARKDIRRKLRSREHLDVEAVPTGDARFEDPAVLGEYFKLFDAVYAQSDIHFDRLTEAFFQAVLRDGDSGGVVFTYRVDGRMIGWNLCFRHGDALVDKYVGLAYPEAREHNLYAVSWMHNLEYAREHGLSRYIAGWTDPEVKAHLGARMTLTRHAVRPRNPLLRATLRKLRRHFESDGQWLKEHADASGRS